MLTTISGSTLDLFNQNQHLIRSRGYSYAHSSLKNFSMFSCVNLWHGILYTYTLLLQFSQYNAPVCYLSFSSIWTGSKLRAETQQCTGHWQIVVEWIGMNEGKQQQRKNNVSLPNRVVLRLVAIHRTTNIKKNNPVSHLSSHTQSTCTDHILSYIIFWDFLNCRCHNTN